MRKLTQAELKFRCVLCGSLPGDYCRSRNTGKPVVSKEEVHGNRNRQLRYSERGVPNLLSVEEQVVIPLSLVRTFNHEQLVEYLLSLVSDLEVREWIRAGLKVDE
jgi:hypothetical protein